VVRAIARSDHWRWVSTPRWSRTSRNATSACQRRTDQRTTCSGSCAGSVQSSASGLAHWRLGNVRRALVLRLAVPGVLGGVFGAYVLVGMPTALVRVFVGFYLLALGGVVLLKALRPRSMAVALPTGQVGVLGFCGGLLDAIGGGGWGQSSPRR
jgi:uncharacterized membrane protein YfcA